MKQMIKRKDGSYSQRGLWDNIRANKGSGKKPTAEMLRQEKKIKSKMQDGGEAPMNRKQKREAFREKVEEGSYDVYRKTSNPQVEKLSQRKTAENILSQPRSETGMGRAGKVKEASKATGWSKGEVREQVPTAFRKKVTNPLLSLIKRPSTTSSSGVLKFPGLQGPSGCKGGGCLDVGSESTMKNGGKVSVKAGGENHVIYKKETKQGKGKPGHIMVNHPTMDKGKWDTIDLTAMNKKIDTVKEGVAATKKWHKEHPYPKGKYQEGGKVKTLPEVKITAKRPTFLENAVYKVKKGVREMFEPKSKMKHGGSHSRLKQAYLNKYK